MTRVKLLGNFDDVPDDPWEANGHVDPARLTGQTLNGDGVVLRGVDARRVRPPRFIWKQRFQMGGVNLLLGEEGVGKGTLTAWIVARITRGDLPGELFGTPSPVLVVGDEDDFDGVWAPKVHAAGGNVELLRTLADGEFLDSLKAQSDDLAQAIQSAGIPFVVFDQLMDHIDGGRGGDGINNPKNIRDSLMPLKRVAHACDSAVQGTLHPGKRGVTFRDLLAGSTQFNAVARSALWLVPDPDDPRKRVLVHGKPPNNAAEPPALELTYRVAEFELFGQWFEVPYVADVSESEHTRESLLTAKAVATREALSEAAEAQKTRAVGDRENVEKVWERIPPEGEPGISRSGLKLAIHGTGVGSETAVAILQRLISEGAAVQTGMRNGGPTYNRASEAPASGGDWG